MTEIYIQSCIDIRGQRRFLAKMQSLLDMDELSLDRMERTGQIRHETMAKRDFLCTPTEDRG